MTPVLVPNAAGNVAPAPTVATVQDRPVTETPSPEWVTDPSPHRPEFALFLSHHQLLI
jgi:hypothetical protein